MLPYQLHRSLIQFFISLVSSGSQCDPVSRIDRFRSSAGVGGNGPSWMLDTWRIPGGYLAAREVKCSTGPAEKKNEGPAETAIESCGQSTLARCVDQTNIPWALGYAQEYIIVPGLQRSKLLCSTNSKYPTHFFVATKGLKAVWFASPTGSARRRSATW